jgi:hypothetical protein
VSFIYTLQGPLTNALTQSSKKDIERSPKAITKIRKGNEMLSLTQPNLSKHTYEMSYPMRCRDAFHLPNRQNARICKFLIHISLYPEFSCATQPLTSTVDDIRRLLDRLGRGIPILLLNRIARKREDRRLMPIVGVRGKDDVFELFASR